GLRRTADALAPGMVRRAVAGVVTTLLTLWLSIRPAGAATLPPPRPAAELVVPVPAPAPGPDRSPAAPPAVVADEAGRLRVLGAADAADLRTPGTRHVVVAG